jgi:hypothetical protein
LATGCLIILPYRNALLQHFVAWGWIVDEASHR